MGDAVGEAVLSAVKEFKPQWSSDIRDEARAVAKELIWADIKKAPKDVKELEDRVDKLERRPVELANELSALKQHCVVINEFNALKQSNSRLESKLDETKNVVVALQSRIATLETVNVAARQEMTAIQQDFDTLRDVVR